jgi:hypothetical protein
MEIFSGLTKRAGLDHRNEISQLNELHSVRLKLNEYRIIPARQLKDRIPASGVSPYGLRDLRRLRSRSIAR